jgi:hypothetical protein
LLNLYYSLYIQTNIPQFSDSIPKPLLRYYCTDETYPAIAILIMNCAFPLPQFIIKLHDSNNNLIKDYVVKASAPKAVYDLSADLAIARPNEKIVSAQFTLVDFGGNSDDFYRHCVNILSNVFISYTYNE